MIRTALLKLEKWDFLANEGANTGRLITIVNWRTYQDEDEPEGKRQGRQRADKGQTKGRPGATNKNVKNVENDKEKNTLLFGEFKNVKLTEKEFESLRKRYGDDCEKMVEKMSQHIATKKRDPYKNHYAAILKNEHWLKPEKKEDGVW